MPKGRVFTSFGAHSAVLHVDSNPCRCRPCRLRLCRFRQCRLRPCRLFLRRHHFGILTGRKLLFALNLDEWNFFLTIRWGIWDGICGVMPPFRSLLRTIVTSYQRWITYQGFQTAILILVLGWMVWCFMFFFDWFFCPLALWSFILTPPYLHELNLYWTRLMSHTSWTSVQYSSQMFSP